LRDVRGVTARTSCLQRRSASPTAANGRVDWPAAGNPDRTPPSKAASAPDEPLALAWRADKAKFAFIAFHLLEKRRRGGWLRARRRGVAGSAIILRQWPQGQLDQTRQTIMILIIYVNKNSPPATEARFRRD
jgi:hypothetical protein